MPELPAREQSLRAAVEPAIAEAYEVHMSKDGQKIGEELPVETGTLYPLGILNRLAGLDEDAGVTPELVQAERESYQQHIAKYRDLGIDLAPVVGLGLHVGKATEDNISWYHARILQAVDGTSEAFNLWLPRWTAEESFHSDLIDNWGNHSGAIDPRLSWHAKVKQIMTGMHVPTDTLAGIVAFTDPQEGLTFDHHYNTGQMVDYFGRRALTVLGGQERRHQRFFRAVFKAAVEADPDYVLPITAKTWRTFAMPGKEGIDNYEENARMLAVHGIFTLAMIRKQQRASAEAVGLLEAEVTTDEAKKAQEDIVQILDMDSKLNRGLHRISRVEKATDEYIARERSAGRIPVILGRTVLFNTEAKELEVKSEAA